MRVLEYLDASGRSPFRRWFDRLDATAAARKAQDAAIKAALEAWQDYKRRKRV